MNSVLFRLTASLLVPLQIALSVIFLLRGHNMPGGGFIGGLVAALAYVMARLAGSSPKMRRWLSHSAIRLILFGWLLMVLSVLPGILSHGAAMQSIWGPEVSILLIGKVKLGTVLLFDLGVYFTVVGSVIKISDVAIQGELS